MPNKRSKDKVYIGGFVKKDLHARLVRYAKQIGMDKNKFGAASGLLETSLNKLEGKKEAKKPVAKPTAKSTPKTAAKSVTKKPAKRA